MLAAQPVFPCICSRVSTSFISVSIFSILWSIQSLAAADVKPVPAEEVVDGLFISVRNPIDSKVAKRVIDNTKRFLDRPDHAGLKIVYDFNPDNFPSSTADYGTCRDLAEYLLKLQDITTIAFIHEDVSGHTVLPVLACKEIIMSAKAKLGDAIRGQSKPLEDDQRVFYELIANRRGRYPAIVLKMVDRDMEVVEGTLHNNLWYIDKSQLAVETKKGFHQTRPESVLKDGERAFYDADQADQFGLSEHLRIETREGVKNAYHLPTTSLREDPLQGRSPNAWRIVIGGQVNKKLQETIEREVRRTIARGGNLIILQLECGDGDTQIARELADFLRSRMDNNGKHPVMTIGYVTKQARNTALFIALGCTEIIMDEGAKLGDFERIIQRRPDYQDAISRSLEDLAEKQGYPPIVGRALLDPKMSVYRVVSRKGKFTEHRLMDGAEWTETNGIKDDRKWAKEEVIKEPGSWLALDSHLAKKLDIAKYVFKGQPPEFGPWVADRYGLDSIQEGSLDWLDEIAAFLCNPVVSVFLVMIGITGLILELKIPGVGLPGVVAALCFVLYFWAHHEQMRGNLTMLAILLFLLGLVLIGMEIFVVPGFGVTGISGVVLMIVSLGLVTLVKKPETTQEWMEFGTTLSSLGGGLVAAVACALVVAWYLPHIPYANRLVLVPPTENADDFGDETGQPKTASALLGTVGVAATALRPAGKVRFGEEFVDVVAEGSYVIPGTRVQIIEIEGNRIVVKEV